MESIITENQERVGWDEALRRVEAYLAAWRIGDSEWVHDCARDVLNSVRRGTVPQGREIQAAIEEADNFLKSYFEKPEATEALVFGAPLHRALDFRNRAQIAEALSDGALNLGRARIPTRPSETRPMTMQTSLSRLPSIRLIGGWIVLIALLFLVFLITHR